MKGGSFLRGCDRRSIGFTTPACREVGTQAGHGGAKAMTCARMAISAASGPNATPITRSARSCRGGSCTGTGYKTLGSYRNLYT